MPWIQAATAVAVALVLHVQAPAPAERTAGAGVGPAVLRGHVLNADTGDPVRRARVTCAIAGRQDTPDVSMTDASGAFEFAGLESGRYFVAATRTGYVPGGFGSRHAEPQRPVPVDLAPGEVFDNADVRLIPAGVITGRITDRIGNPVIDVEVVAGRNLPAGFLPITTSYTDDRGAYRLWGLRGGQYYILSRPTSFSVSGAEGGVVSSTAVYPGVASIAQASAVPVEGGRETANIDFSVTPVRLSRVRGTVADALGNAAAGARGRISSLDETTGRRVEGNAFVTDKSGAFDVVRVPPGVYEASASISKGSVISEHGASAFVASGGDVRVSVITSPVSTIRGLVRSSGGALPAGIRMRVAMTSADLGRDRIVAGNSDISAVAKDGTFAVAVAPGPVVPRLIGLPSRWQVAAILANQRDLAGRSIEIAPGTDPPLLEIVVSNDGAEVSGRVVDDRQREVPGAYVLVFTAEPDRFMTNGQVSLVERTNQRGEFRIGGLRPGDYMAAAVDEPDDVAVFSDPRYLNRLRRDGAIGIAAPHRGRDPLVLPLKREGSSPGGTR